MPSNLLNNVNVAALDVLPTPDEIKRRLPMTATAEATVLAARQTAFRWPVVFG